MGVASSAGVLAGTDASAGGIIHAECVVLALQSTCELKRT